MAFTKLERELVEQKDSLVDKIAQYVDVWICKLFNFLEEERFCQSKRTLNNFLFPIHAVVRFQHLGKTKYVNFKSIPALVEINKHIHALNKAIKNQQPIVNLEMKWLDLDKVHKQIVEPLRLECEFRANNRVYRSITAITSSFIRFISWGLLTYRPPRRQQELRELKTSLYCKIEEKPNNLAQKQFIHPLPYNRITDKYHGYLYKDQDGNWYQHMSPESYKTGKTYGLQNLLIPNQKFPDGKCFYDYLEAYLYGYWRDKKGNWVSAGNTTEAPSIQHKLYALRMALNPKNNYQFVSRDKCDTLFHECDFVLLSARKGKPLSGGDFTRFFQSQAHRLTGKLLTPHLLRDIYASWFLDRPYTEDVIRSLAYAMGHSVEEMRRTYDKRKAQRKHEPIQKKLDETLNQLLGFNEPKATARDIPPEGVDPALWAILTPEIKATYQKLLGAV
jgi:hypothetical protein